MMLALGGLQVAAVEIYVTDPALECESCKLLGRWLDVADPEAARVDVLDGINSADADGDGQLRDALTRLLARMSHAARAPAP